MILILEKTVPLILVFVLGFFLKRRRILLKEDSRVFSKLLIDVVIPIIIVDAFANITLESNLIYLPLASLVVLVSFLVLGFMFSALLGLKEKLRGSFITAFPTLEAGTIGYAFMLAVFGELGLSRIVLFDSANIVFLFTVVYLLSYKFGKGNITLKTALLKVLKSPYIWAILIGLLINITGFQNAFVSNFFDIVGSATLLLIMLFLGLEFEPSISSFKLPAVNIVIKMACGLSLALIVSMLFGFTGIERTVFIIWASLPPSIVALIFAKENGLDTKYLANLVSIGLIVGIIFITVILNFL